MKIKTKSTKNSVTSIVNLELNKDLILKTPKHGEKSDRVMEVKKVTYGET